MAIAIQTIWEFQSLATGSMVNGGGFNPSNAGMLTNLTTDANTANTNSPVVSSASYNFAAGDVNNWLYIKSGTNWTPGWYQIASVGSNKATLSAAIGQAIQTTGTGGTRQVFTTNMVAGCATVGTPTNGTFTIDYSMSTTAKYSPTDLASTGASTTLTSATAGFTPVMVGNMLHQTTTGTGGFGVVGWYEIATYVNSSTVTTDRTTNSGTAEVSVTGFVGGALSLNSTLDDDFLEIVIGGNQIFFKKDGLYTVGEAVAVASTSSSITNPIFIDGYNATRGDNPTGTNRPTIAAGANTFGGNQYWTWSNLIITTTEAAGFNPGAGTNVQYVGMFNCKVTNTSTTTTRLSVTLAGSIIIMNCEMVSQNGYALGNGSNRTRIFGSYIHDSDRGMSTAGNQHPTSLNTIWARNRTSAFDGSSSSYQFLNSTIYGRQAKIGTGINLSGATQGTVFLLNNIFYGLVTAIAQTTALLGTNIEDYNDFFNNTTDRSLYNTGINSIALNPNFTDATEIVGSTATTSGSVLTQSGGDFSTVEDNVDYLNVLSGTGVTTGGYLIISHTATTVTVNNALGTSSGGDVVYYIGTGHDFRVGTTVKARAFPGTFPGPAAGTIGYLDMGAAQRQDNAMLFIPNMEGT